MSSIAPSSSVIPSVIPSVTAPRAARATAWGQVARVALATTVAAVAANTLVYFIGGALIAYDPHFLPLADVSGQIAFTLPAALGAILVYALLLRFARQPVRTFTIIAAVVLVVATIPDFTYIPTVAGATGGQTAILVVMHLVAAAVIVRMLTTLARPSAR